MNTWGITHRGVVREENQDAFVTRMLSQQQALGLVCDGMGGARGGRVASSMAVETFDALFTQLVADGTLSLDQVLLSAAAHANESVYRRANKEQKYHGMGTTMVAALLNESHAYVLNEGDSRAYHITAERIVRVTRDHSFVEDMVQRGELTEEEARFHPNKNLITRALGAEAELRADLFELDVREGEYLLLCSDGLSNIVSDQEILYEVLHGGEAEDCCRRLLDIALKRGAPDNVTVVLMAR